MSAHLSSSGVGRACTTDELNANHVTNRVAALVVKISTNIVVEVVVKVEVEAKLGKKGLELRNQTFR